MASSLPWSGSRVGLALGARPLLPALLGSPGQRTDCAGGHQGQQEGEVEAGHRGVQRWGLLVG